MYATAADKSTLRVGRFRAQYLVPSDHHAPESIKNALDETVRKAVPAAVGFALSSCFSDNDSSVWFIRKLELDLDLNAGWDAQRQARAWAVRFARSLSWDLRNEGNGIIRFASRSAHLSQFIVDLANGCAWGKYYYECFEGLRLLPTSAAVRTALCNEPTDGLAAMLQLGAHDLTKLIGAITAPDATRILEKFAQHAPHASDESRCLESLLEAWTRLAPQNLHAIDEKQTALLLYLLVQRSDPSVSGQPLKTISLAVVRLVHCLQGESVPANKRLLAVLIWKKTAALYQEFGADAEVLLPLMRCSVAALKQAARILTSETHEAEDRSGGTPAYTRFGGMFLLLPLLDALPWERAMSGWPDPPARQDPFALMRFLILVKCFGGTRSQSISHDPLARDLLEIQPRVTPALIKKWQVNISNDQLENFMRELSVWQYEQGALKGDALVLFRVRMRRGAAALLLDIERGCWMYGAQLRPAGSNYVIDRLGEWLGQSDLAPEMILAERSFLGTSGIRAFSGRIVGLEDVGDSLDHEHLKTTLPDVKAAQDDIEYLESPREFHYSVAFDLACSIAAQQVMRSFAWRLPGFARSSLAYLHRNFLDLAGSLETEADRFVVRLGKPPLNIVLSLTGMTRATHQPGWRNDGRQLALFPEE